MSPTSQPSATTEPTTFPSLATRPSLKPEQLRFLDAAKTYTGGRAIRVGTDLAKVKAEADAVKGGPVLSSLKEDQSRVVTASGKINYRFKTLAIKKALADKLAGEIAVLQREKDALASGVIFPAPLDLQGTLQVGDSGTVSDKALVLQVLSGRQCIVDYHSLVFQIEGIDTTGFIVKSMVPLPPRVTITGSREYFNRFGNVQTILILTAVEEFDLKAHAKDE